MIEPSAAAIDENSILLVVNGMMRSGTIWATRLLADSLQVASQTVYRDPPHIKGDAAIWRLDRPGKFIRRLHYYTFEYPYSDALPMVTIIRDPRDVAVSIAHFYDRDMNDALLWTMPRWVHFYSCWAQDQRQWTMVRYKDLLQGPRFEIERVLSNVGLAADFEAKTKAIHDNEFNRMDNHDKGRYGHDGAWRENLDLTVTRAVWHKYEDAIEKLGYSWRQL